MKRIPKTEEETRALKSYWNRRSAAKRNRNQRTLLINKLEAIQDMEQATSKRMQEEVEDVLPLILPQTLQPLLKQLVPPLIHEQVHEQV